jgi:RimJ/RimL family protein N-acetyltransferase
MLEGTMPLTGYPKSIRLRDNTTALLRPLGRYDGKHLLEFYQALPEEDRLSLRDDVTRPEWVRRFLEQVGSGEVISFGVEIRGALVGAASLYRVRHGWSAHVGELRISVASGFRRKGVGSILASVLVRVARGTGVEKLVAQMMGQQGPALRTFERLGFAQEAVLRDQVKDLAGRTHDLLVYTSAVAHMWETVEAIVAEFNPDLESGED